MQTQHDNKEKQAYNIVVLQKDCSPISQRFDSPKAFRFLYTSNDSIYRKYWYIIFDIDISYRIVLSKKYRIFWYIAISFICHDIFDISWYFMPEVYIFISALPK